MEYTKLGNSGIEISKLCVGCMSFGKPSADFHEWTLDPEKTEEIVRHALELGINFFDTANTYSHGTSEEYLGRAIQCRPRQGCARLKGLFQRGASLESGDRA